MRRLAAIAVVSLGWAGLAAGADPQEVRFNATGYTEKGEWSAEAVFSPASWRPGLPLSVQATLQITESHLAHLA